MLSSVACICGLLLVDRDPAILGMRVGVVGLDKACGVPDSMPRSVGGTTTEGEPVIVGSVPLIREDSAALDKRIERGGTGSGRFWTGVAS